MADITNPTTNVSVYGGDNESDLTKAVTVTTDGAKERLDCDITGTVNIDNNESPTKYQLKTAYDITGTALNTSTDTELFTYSGSGVIDLIAVNSLTSSNWEIVIDVDGTERLRITMSALGSSLGLTNSDYDVAVTTANKQFRYHPVAMGFATDFTIKAKATTGSPNVNYMVMYRERLT